MDILREWLRDPAAWSAIFAGLALLVAGYMALLTKGMTEATKRAASAADRSSLTGQHALEAAKVSAQAARISAAVAQAGLSVQFVIQPVDPPLAAAGESRGPRIGVRCHTATVFVHSLEVQWLATAARAHRVNAVVGMTLKGVPQRIHPGETVAGPVQQPMTQEVLDLLDNPKDVTGGEATVWYSFGDHEEPIPIEAPVFNLPVTWTEPTADH